MLNKRQLQIGFERCLPRLMQDLQRTTADASDEVGVSITDFLNWHYAAINVLNSRRPGWLDSYDENQRGVVLALRFARGKVVHAHSRPHAEEVEFAQLMRPATPFVSGGNNWVRDGEPRNFSFWVWPPIVTPASPGVGELFYQGHVDGEQVLEVSQRAVEVMSHAVALLPD